ncbi:MAG: Y-family DNA polymerase [Balneolaceae bacterium]|nr:MAG: Y-family DNA polymerase [Balneolaceae bacterium]
MPFALVDCNNFYASCERVFDPSLKNKPLVILSNNDGCVIARSAEAKEAGIPMGVPEFKIRPLIRKNRIAMRSSNYALYGDMSMRVMDILTRCTPNTEVYSIDEAFTEIHGHDTSEIIQTGKTLRERIMRDTGIAVSVGIASTKTLAKIANEAAKTDTSHGGVLCLDNEELVEKVLKQTAVSDVWGVGRNYSNMLSRYSVNTAFDLKELPDTWVRSKMKVTGLRTVWELRGRSCLNIEECSDTRKGILSSRSFGKPANNCQDICEAVSHFSARAAEKLRSQKSVATNITVTLITDKYKAPGRPYKFGATYTLPNATADSGEIITTASTIARQLFERGKIYKKAWVMLTGIVPQSEIQQDLFNAERYSEKKRYLMETLDQLNAKYGKRTVLQASTGIDQCWQMKQQYLSKKYTTNWNELMTVGV